MNRTDDDFETIAKDAVIALTSVIFTLRITGEPELAAAIAATTEALIDRAIALGGE